MTNKGIEIRGLRKSYLYFRVGCFSPAGEKQPTQGNKSVFVYVHSIRSHNPLTVHYGRVSTTPADCVVVSLLSICCGIGIVPSQSQRS